MDSQSLKTMIIYVIFFSIYQFNFYSINYLTFIMYLLLPIIVTLLLPAASTRTENKILWHAIFFISTCTYTHRLAVNIIHQVDHLHIEGPLTMSIRYRNRGRSPKYFPFVLSPPHCHTGWRTLDKSDAVTVRSSDRYIHHLFVNFFYHRDYVHWFVRMWHNTDKHITKQTHHCYW